MNGLRRRSHLVVMLLAVLPACDETPGQRTANLGPALDDQRRGARGRGAGGDKH